MDVVRSDLRASAGGEAVPANTHIPGTWRAWALLSSVRFPFWLGLIWAALFLLAVTGYPDLCDNEKRVGAYALDLLRNGNWSAQHDLSGEFISKPPALTWMVAFFSWCFGGLSLISLYLPSALATLAVAYLVFSAGARHFGFRAGAFASLMYLLSYAADRQLTTVRYDGLFAFPVVLGSLAAYRAWTTGRGWFVFWVAMTFGTMVKGPLVFLLAMAGLSAVFWEGRRGQLFRWRISHLAGICLFALVCGGWCGFVFSQYGDEFLDKMIRRELIGHAIKDSGSGYPGHRFWEAPLAVFLHFLPWSVVGIAGIVAAVRGRNWRDSAPIPRSFERYTVCWLVSGLLLMSLSAHQRGRLTWPLLAPLALLAGRQLDLWLQNGNRDRVQRWACGVVVVLVAVIGVQRQFLLRFSEKARLTLAMRDLAATLESRLGRKPAVMYVDAPFAVQFYLDDRHDLIKPTIAANQLNEDSPGFVVASARAAEIVRSHTTNRLYTLYVWPPRGQPQVELLSNRPDLALTSRHASDGMVEPQPQ